MHFSMNCEIPVMIRNNKGKLNLFGVLLMFSPRFDVHSACIVSKRISCKIQCLFYYHYYFGNSFLY